MIRKLAVILAVAAAIGAAQAQQPSAVCEESGGEWSDCASACPATCDNFNNPPLFCIQLCVVGCVCPSGTVLNDAGQCVATTDCPSQVRLLPPLENIYITYMLSTNKN